MRNLLTSDLNLARVRLSNCSSGLYTLLLDTWSINFEKSQPTGWPKDGRLKNQCLSCISFGKRRCLTCSGSAILVAFLLVGRFLLAEGTILFGDFTPTLEVRQSLKVNYPLWPNRNSFNYIGSMRLPYLIIFYFLFYITVGDVPVRVPSVIEVDPTKYVVELDADRPFMLRFSNAYDPAWTASFGGQTVKSVRIFSVANGFWIDAVGRVVVTVEFQPQRWVYYGVSCQFSFFTYLCCLHTSSFMG